jgi:protein subunit release factor A
MGKLDTSDIEVTTSCLAVHPDRRGGQHVSRPCTGVRVMHRPTGIGVFVNSEQSQMRNHEHAMARLRLVLEALQQARVITWADEP